MDEWHPDATELFVASLPQEIRDELVERVLTLLERFNDEHGLTLDLPGRIELLDSALEEWVAAIESQRDTDPVH